MRSGVAFAVFALGLASASVSFAQGAPPSPNPPPALGTAPLEKPVVAFDTRAPIIEGSAGPATSAGSTGLLVKPGLEIIADYDLHIDRAGEDNGYTTDNQFELQRGHVSLDAAYGPATARFVLEAVRSASEGALIGVSGDSLVFRVREASVGWHPVPFLDFEGGVVPTFAIPELDGTFAARAVAETALESTGLSSPADLGGTARLIFPRGYGFVGIGAYNGEGYTGQELNRGKNLEPALELHPIPDLAKPLAIFGSFVDGSTGTGSARSNRATAALLWQGLRIRAGVAFTYAWGVGEDGNQLGWLLDGFARTEPIDRLIFAVRAFWWQRDTRVRGDAVGEVTAAGGFRIVTPLEAFLAVTRTLPQSTAAVALPDVDAWDVRVIGHVVF